MRVNGMTIKEIFSRGEISSYTFSVCIINRIKTFYDVMLHYSESEAFKNLRYIEDKSNKELIELYNRYKDVYIEEKRNQTAFEKKYEVQLENVVTDMDEVMKTTLTPDDVFKEMEQKIEDYWSKEYCLETPQDDDIEDAVKPTSESKIVDLKSIEKQLAEYWGDGVVEKEQVPEYKNSVLSESTFAAVSDVVVDLEKIAQTLNQDRNENSTLATERNELVEIEQKVEDYWSKENCLETPQNDNIEYAVKPTSESKFVDLKSIERQLADYWGDGVEEKEQDPEYKNRVLSESIYAAVSDVVVDIEEIAQTLNQDRN